LAALSDRWNNLKSKVDQSTETCLAKKANDAQSARLGKRGIGRPQGSGSLESEDIKLIDEMRTAIRSGKYPSIAAAARAMVAKAGGAGTEASKEKRLCTRYAERYPN
jgi:hypothetical protein